MRNVAGDGRDRLCVWLDNEGRRPPAARPVLLASRGATFSQRFSVATWATPYVGMDRIDPEKTVDSGLNKNVRLYL